jgi:dihydroorotate dehydrogenase
MCEIVAYVRKHLPHICIIAAGGIDSSSKAWHVREYCGADLVQILTAIAFHGFGIARQIKVGLKLNQIAQVAA